MCNIATLKFLYQRATRVARRCVKGFFYARTRRNIFGSLSRGMAVMAFRLSVMKLKQRVAGYRLFFCLRAKQQQHGIIQQKT